MVRGNRLFLLRRFHRGRKPTRDVALLHFKVVVDKELCFPSALSKTVCVAEVPMRGIYSIFREAIIHEMKDFLSNYFIKSIPWHPLNISKSRGTSRHNVLHFEQTSFKICQLEKKAKSQNVHG